jgi:hypothetical protein
MRKQFALILFFLSIKLCSYAQGNYGGGVDDEIVHFGFTFQYIQSEFKIYKKTDWQKRNFSSEPPSNANRTDSIYSISSPIAPGFGLGFVTNLRLGNNADLRFTPSLVFTDRLLNYTFRTAEPEQREVLATMIDLPIGIKLKSDRRLNFRAYLLAGGKFSSDIVSKKRTDDAIKAITEKYVKNNKNILSYEVGIGFDFYFEFFKLSPELKLSNSFNSVFKPESHPFSSPIDKLYLRNFIFSLYFE